MLLVNFSSCKDLVLRAKKLSVSGTNIATNSSSKSVSSVSTVSGYRRGKKPAAGPPGGNITGL